MSQVERKIIVTAHSHSIRCLGYYRIDFERNQLYVHLNFLPKSVITAQKCGSSNISENVQLKGFVSQPVVFLPYFLFKF